MGHLGKGHCDGRPLMPQHEAEPSLPPPPRCRGASVASNESHRHPLAHKSSLQKCSTCLVETPVVVGFLLDGLTLAIFFSFIFVGKMCVFVSRRMKIVTFLLKNGETAQQVVDFP